MCAAKLWPTIRRPARCWFAASRPSSAPARSWQILQARSRRCFKPVPGVAEAVRALTGGTAPHIVIEATGRSDVALEAVGLVGDHGHVVLLGSPRAAHSGDITGLRRNSIARPRNTGTKRLCAPSNSPPHSRGGQVFRSSPRNGGKDKWCRHECIDVPLLVRSPRGDCPAAARTTLLKC